MRTRHIEILNILLKNRKVAKNIFMDLYSISRRTLYYDIELINDNISQFGEIKVLKGLVLIDLKESENELKQKIFKPYLDSEERQKAILFSILEKENLILEDYAAKFGVSQTTIFSDIQKLKSNLKSSDIEMEYYNNRYNIKGSEKEIRNNYLHLLFNTPFKYSQIDEKIKYLNINSNLNLSDYSLYYLSKFIKFIDKRNMDSYFIENKYVEDVHQYLPVNLSKYLDSSNSNEEKYLKCFILSLANIKHQDISGYVDEYVRSLLSIIKKELVLDIVWSETLILNLKNHLMCSYFRIKYDFPALNQQLLDIKIRYFYLFSNLKRIIHSLKYQPFNSMKEEEIGFVVAYVGGYLYKNRLLTTNRKIIIVCPQGRAVSNHLMLQIKRYFPEINILGTHSIDQLGSIVTNYDYIISTVDMPKLGNVLKVNPILNDSDITMLESIFGVSKTMNNQVSRILETIKEYATIHDESQLKKEITEIIRRYDDKKGKQPMLDELITKERIKKVKSVNSWEEAIQEAAQPLIKDGSITQNYVTEMIENVNKYGPYIVLKDGFALPHASSKSGVNHLSMSLMVLDEPVDIFDKKADIFMVLGTVDNESHLKALTSLTKIISDDENIEKIRKSSIGELYKLIQTEGR